MGKLFVSAEVFVGGGDFGCVFECEMALFSGNNRRWDCARFFDSHKMDLVDIQFPFV